MRASTTPEGGQPSLDGDGDEDGAGDVYMYEPTPLTEGLEKHTISVFVADETGLINRVAGTFARRGVNIESLAVGLNVDKALFTIAVNETPRQVANVVKQLSKLVKVRYVEDITNVNRVDRELILLKLRAPAGPARTEVLQIAEIFRARPIDVSDHSLTLACSGDAGKVAAFQKSMSKFGVLQVVRTGRITLKRGAELLETGLDGQGGAAAHRAAMRRLQEGSPAAEDTEASEVVVGDAYANEDQAVHGVWEVRNIIEAAYDPAAADIEPHTLSIDVNDAPGVLNTVTGVIARRGYNIQSLAVGPSEMRGRSRITMVIPGQAEGVDNLLKQIRKLVIVQEVSDFTGQPIVQRELMMVKVRCTASQRSELHTLCNIFRAVVCDVCPTTMTIEIGGKQDKMLALQDTLADYGVLEAARTGTVAMLRDSGVDSKYLQRRQISNYL